MSLKIYLDDCAYSYRLRQLLLEAGYQVQIPVEAEPSLVGAKNAVHFAYAQRTQQLLLTYNPSDFEQLHWADKDHAGILAVYQDNDITRDMSYQDIVRAIQNLVSINIPLTGGFWVLNAYQW
ncbi:MAG: DUF5615 family PIN-like protein [Caldilineaceae bacterium]|nr:DUF5615 family PIN-like protein [Caldilineaceae bacterium]